MNLHIPIVEIRSFITKKDSVPGFVKVNKISTLNHMYKVKDEEGIIWTASNPILASGKFEIPQMGKHGIYAKINDDYQNNPQIIVPHWEIELYLANYKDDRFKQDCLWNNPDQKSPLVYFR